MVRRAATGGTRREENELLTERVEWVAHDRSSTRAWSELRGDVPISDFPGSSTARELAEAIAGFTPDQLARKNKAADFCQVVTFLVK